MGEDSLLLLLLLPGAPLTDQHLSLSLLSSIINYQPLSLPVYSIRLSSLVSASLVALENRMSSDRMCVYRPASC